MRCTRTLGNWIALPMSILSRGTSQFLPKLAKLVYTARQVVSWQGRYNDELDRNGVHASTCLWCMENGTGEKERGKGKTENG